jgi:tetratricopeptide (TPR) repeat protein
MKLSLALFGIAALLVGCANPLNQATSDRYAEECAGAERRAQLPVAEEACYRAVKNVDWGNLGADLKSQRLYNLARIKRQLGKFAEAEIILKESIAIEETVSGAGSLKVARRLVELSVNLAAQDKWIEGAEHLARVIPLAAGFSGQERSFTKTSYLEYGKKLKALGQVESAARFETAAGSM